MALRSFFQILPRDQGKQPSEKNIDQVTLTQNDNPDADKAGAIETEQERRVLISGQRNLQGASAEGKPQLTACVVGLSSETGDTTSATWTPPPRPPTTSRSGTSSSFPFEGNSDNPHTYPQGLSFPESASLYLSTHRCFQVSGGPPRTVRGRFHLCGLLKKMCVFLLI